MAEIELNRGSDVDFRLIWSNGPLADDPPMDLTGFTLEIYEAHPELTGSLVVTISDAPAGEISGRLTWHDAMPRGAVMGFILRISDGETRTALPRIRVNVK